MLIIAVVFIKAQDYKIILSVPWNAPDGIPTSLSISRNSGVSDFTIIDENTIALLCDVEEKVKVYDCSKNTLLHEFSLNNSVNHIAYDKEKKIFYLDDYEYMYCYCYDGTFIRKVEINRNRKLITEDIIAEDGNLIISNPIQAGMIIENGRVISTSEQLQKRKNMAYLGNNIYTDYSKKSVNGKAHISLYKNDTIIHSFDMDVEESYSAPLPIGIAGNIFVYFQIRYPKHGIAYRLAYYSLDSGAVVDTITTPSIYFTSQKTKYIVDDGMLYNLITAPDSLYIVKKEITSKSSSIKNNHFPERFNYYYHY